MLKKILGKSVWLAIAASSTLFASGENQADSNPMQNEIKHVVMLMLENRSFDNVLGWLHEIDDTSLQFIPPGTDPHFLGLSEEILDKYTNVLRDSNGNLVYSSAPIKGVPSSSDNFINSPKYDPNEPFPNVTVQIFGADGEMEPCMCGFLQDYATFWKEGEWEDQKLDICAVMETYTEKELPVMYGLARHYAVSDLWFSSVPTQTNPNRAFSICGTSEGEIVNGDLGENVFHADTIWNRLSEEAPNATWGIFWHGELIPDVLPGCYTGPNTFANMNKIPNLDSHYYKFDKFHQLARNGQLPTFSYLEPLWTLSENISPSQKFLDDLLDKGQELLLGVQGNDLHPPGDVRTAENLLANVYTSLIANPEAWEHTLLIITFDEHGGLFDHINPPTAIAPDDKFQHGFKFDRYGVRIPTLLISPKINKGVVFRAENPDLAYDHTSTLATLLKWQNVDPTKWNLGKRVDAAPTFENVITRSDSRVDYVIAEENAPLPQIVEANVVRMGEKFHLRNKDGYYITLTKHLIFEDRAPLKFAGGDGKITHGSFALVQADDPALGENNLLETSLSEYHCSFEANNHSPGQWWTVKSKDHPYVGLEIQYGDKIYLECHSYLDVLQCVPCRLIVAPHLLWNMIRTKMIVEEGSEDNYWIIERA